MNAALLIIDVQNGLFSDSNCPIYQKDQLLRNINTLVQRANNADVPIIYIHHTDKWLRQGSKEWDLHSIVKPKDEYKAILKHTPDSFFNTSLYEELKSKNIEELIIAGLQTEYCIDTTCRRAFSLDFHTILVKDAHSTCDNYIMSAQSIIEYHNQVLSDWFVELKTTEQISFDYKHSR